MTFSYAQPVAGVFPSLKDEIRFLVQDTVSSAFSVSDEEIAYMLKTYDDQVYITASQVAQSISTKYGKEASVSSRNVGDLSLSTQYAESAKWYKELSDSFKTGKPSGLAQPFFNETPSIFIIGQFDDKRP
jgi:hypothetical protein